MNDVTKPAATAISTAMIDRLRSGIAESRASTVLAGGGKPYLRMLKSGEWVYGQRDDEVQEGSSWAINPLSIQHGWVAWTNHEGNTKNTRVGEVMAPVFEAKPPKPAPVDNWPFSEQRSFDLKCLDGDDAGVEVQYYTTSLGGMKAVDALLAALQVQLGKNPRFPCPVVELKTESYAHAKYGRIYTPLLEVVDYSDMQGATLSAVEIAADAPAPEPEPAKPAKAPLKAPLRAAPTEPAPTAAARGGSPRRRPEGR